MFEISKSHQFLQIAKKKKNPLIVYWFARHGKQPTLGKTSAKATLVSGDTIREWRWCPADAGSGRKLSLGNKTHKGVCMCVSVCTHRISDREGMELQDGSGQSLWALPAWPLCPLPPTRGPCAVSQTAAPSSLLASWVFLFYLLLEENSLALWVCCGSNKLPLFLPTLKCYKKQQSGQVTASWEGSHKSWAQWWREASESMHQDLCLCVLPLRGTHILRQQQIHPQIHTRTRSSVNPGEV